MMSFSAILLSIFLILFGYLIGSIPTAFLAGKWIKGLDLRKYGSGTVSASMTWEHVAHWAFIPVGVFDILKAAFATWLVMKLGGGVLLAILAGLAAVIGHNWPIYLNFTGGRGLSPFLGMLLVIFPWGFPWMVAFLAVGYLLGDTAPSALASLILLPLLVDRLGGSVVIIGSACAMVFITVVKRLEANKRPLPKDLEERRKVIWLRLLFDRDIVSHSDWIRRKPSED